MQTSATKARQPARSERPLNGPPAAIGGWRLTDLINETRWLRSYRAILASSGSSASEPFLLTVVREDLERPSDRELAQGLLVREAEVAAAVAHRHLMPTFSVERDSQRLWSIQPFLDALSLSKTAALSLPQTLWTIRQTAEALDALHKARWLHGDLTPEAVLLDSGGHTTLGHLGNARRIGTEECDVAITSFVGQLCYASPELFAIHGQLTAAVDIYSLGAVLFELLSGHPLLAQYEGAELVAAKQLLPRPDLSNIAHVPFSLMSLLSRMLSRESLRRPTASEVIEALMALEIELLPQWMTSRSR